ncbi:hypothetical protein XA68_10223 [Ophiocordyceps unilateralis]|uniref:RING-type E3 ubiquitin transferase n=1 Tax=Ophiocordyceps unilateralis TaxID=268505 RepID=A0A2A9PJ67_OPHUN|nr:hypothetical protein XA68_10223 [Ophiocordyceps unilateralis]
MRLGWYAGVSTALAGGVVISAFLQRANFYSAMVYLAQSNFCLLALVNFSLLLYSSFIYGLTRLCFGTLRAVEVEQLTERAWFAITETCLAMTIFREEIGAWFLVMFTALVTGKVWGWIGDGRVEFLEQQPPQNPRLFHFRLSISLAMSFMYDVLILRYSVRNVIQQARPNMMVMFLFEFAVLATCSWRTAARYLLVLAEQNIIRAQTRKRLLERRQEVREQREALLRQREQAAAAGENTPANDEPLPSEDDVDEMDIDVPGWSTKGEWVLWLDLLSDMIKLGIYVAFFFMLLMFYGLPIHIMRDLFMTSRDFIKRLNALLRYRRAIQEMNRYPDASADDLAQENTCIICREEMRPWDPVENPGAIDRVRPKKLPCGHILHLGCLKSWLERQQVCPTCRSPVTADRGRGRPPVGPPALRIQLWPPRPQGQQPPADDAQQGQGNDGPQQRAPREGGPRIFNLGPIRLGFGTNGQQIRELAQQFGVPHIAGNQAAAAAAGAQAPDQSQTALGDNLQSIGNLLRQSEQMLQRETQRLSVPWPAAHNLPMNLPFPPAQQLPVPAPGNQTHPLGLPILPGAPSRSGSPLMARLGTSGATAPIPAGSADLPEGLTLPPGWSVVPLQRLDGSPIPGPVAPQPQMPLHDGDAATSSRQTANGQPAPVPVPGGTPSHTGGDVVDPEPPADDLPSTEARPTVEPAALVAPSPVMPRWGGPSQLFNNGPRLGLDEPEQQPGESSSAEVPRTEAGERVDTEEEGESLSKGKTKVVAVEEAHEEE